jgi:hypothetical protein
MDCLTILNSRRRRIFLALARIREFPRGALAYLICLKAPRAAMRSLCNDTARDCDMTSDALLHDLAIVERLIAALSVACRLDDEALRDLRWLQARRKYLSGLLGVRRAQRGKKIVSLTLWRSGHASASAQIDKVA